MKGNPDWTLYFITDSERLEQPSYWNFLESSLENGVTILQLRFKGISDRHAYQFSERAVSLCRAFDVPLIINDRLDVAMVTGADGVHLGITDLPLKNVRKVWKGLLGATAHTYEEAVKAERSGADYIGWGCIFPSSSKHVPLIVGPESISEVKRMIKIPVIAIGGITPDNLSKVLASGADGIASIDALNTLGPQPFAQAIKTYESMDKDCTGFKKL
jgi:thiamine-phosphate pyrophosphorylase